jgi:hypothetical protein
MSENKKKIAASATGFLNCVPEEHRRLDSFTLLELMRRISGQEPAMRGPSIVGFGGPRRPLQLPDRPRGRLVRCRVLPAQAEPGRLLPGKHGRLFQVRSNTGPDWQTPDRQMMPVHRQTYRHRPRRAERDDQAICGISQLKVKLINDGINKLGASPQGCPSLLFFFYLTL